MRWAALAVPHRHRPGGRLLHGWWRSSFKPQSKYINSFRFRRLPSYSRCTLSSLKHASTLQLDRFQGKACCTNFWVRNSFILGYHVTRTILPEGRLFRCSRSHLTKNWQPTHLILKHLNKRIISLHMLNISVNPKYHFEKCWATFHSIHVWGKEYIWV